MPVYHDNLERIAGFVYLKDLLWAWKNKQSGFSDELIRPPYFVKHDKKIYELLREFQSGQTHLAFVNDAFGSLAGIVTLEDLLEEIVGEILDEYDLKDREAGKS